MLSSVSLLLIDLMNGYFMLKRLWLTSMHSRNMTSKLSSCWISSSTKLTSNSILLRKFMSIFGNKFLDLSIQYIVVFLQLCQFSFCLNIELNQFYIIRFIKLLCFNWMNILHNFIWATFRFYLFDSSLCWLVKFRKIRKFKKIVFYYHLFTHFLRNSFYLLKISK
jgi:hypothetical protein